MLIDFHTHAFPEQLAPRALASLAERIHLSPQTDGTVPGLIRRMDEWQVDRAVVCNIATNSRQMKKVNDFAILTAQQYGDRVTPLGSVHPQAEHVEEEIARLHGSGVKGLKLHPDYMETMLDDPAFDPIFEAAAAFGMFIVTHAGYDVFSPEKVWADPAAVRNRLRRSPKTELICAHFGGNMMWQEVEETLVGLPVTFDTSLATASGLPKEQAARILLRHDEERIVFGSDCPWCGSREIFEYVDSLPVSDDRKEKIYFRNAERLLK